MEEKYQPKVVEEKWQLAVTFYSLEGLAWLCWSVQLPGLPFLFAPNTPKWVNFVEGNQVAFEHRVDTHKQPSSSPTMAHIHQVVEVVLLHDVAMVLHHGPG